MATGFGAAADLGLGNALNDQQLEMTEEEKRRRKLGLSPLSPGGAAQSLFGYGSTGIAPMQLGVGGGRGR